MTWTFQRTARLMAGAAAAALALGFVAESAGALAAVNGNVAYAKGSSVTAVVTVKAINPATRELTVTGSDGDALI